MSNLNSPCDPFACCCVSFARRDKSASGIDRDWKHTGIVYHKSVCFSSIDSVGRLARYIDVVAHHVGKPSKRMAVQNDQMTLDLRVTSLGDSAGVGIASCMPGQFSERTTCKVEDNLEDRQAQVSVFWMPKYFILMTQ